MQVDNQQESVSASQLIDKQIADLPDWRGQMLKQLRQWILEAVPGITEEWKWGTGVWSQKGNVVAAAAFNDHIKLNFFKGASLDDPNGLFNAGLEAKATRAIDFYENDILPEKNLKDLLQTAAALNSAGGKKK